MFSLHVIAAVSALRAIHRVIRAARLTNMFPEWQPIRCPQLSVARIAMHRRVHNLHIHRRQRAVVRRLLALVLLHR